MERITTRFPIIALCLALAAGCGGGSDPTPAPAPAPPPPAPPPIDTSTPLALKVERVHVNQVVQNDAGNVPLFADRAGLLRVFVVANRTNDATPRVRVEVFHDGALTDTHYVDAQSSLVPTEVDAADLNLSWNVVLPAGQMRDGVAVRATVDPDGDFYDGSDRVFPASGDPMPIEVVRKPVFRTTLVPVNYGDTTTTVNQNVLNQQFSIFERIFPVPDIDVVVREPYTTTRVTQDTVDLQGLLQELRALRDSDGSDRYYYGNVSWGPFNRPAHGGIAYLGFPVGLGQNGNSWIYAHEVGHNFSLEHAPCGNPPNPDPAFPHSGGTIGFPGWDIASGALRPPTAVDIMSYCSSQTLWISDYMYRKAFNFLPTGAGSAPAPATSLVIWGGADDDGITLRPSFLAERVPTPDADGPFLLEGLDRFGAVLFTRRFAGDPLVHGHDGERHFSIAVPATEAELDELTTLRVRGPHHVAEIHARHGSGQKAAANAQAVRLDDARVRVTWDAAHHPLAVIRNPETGNVLSFAEGGSVTIVTGAERLDVDFSDGVRTSGAGLQVERQ